MLPHRHAHESRSRARMRVRRVHDSDRAAVAASLSVHGEIAGVDWLPAKSASIQSSTSGTHTSTSASRGSKRAAVPRVESSGPRTISPARGAPHLGRGNLAHAVRAPTQETVRR